MCPTCTNEQAFRDLTSPKFGIAVSLLPILALLTLLGGCSSKVDTKLEDELLAKERQRSEAEQNAQQNVLEQELLARSIAAKTNSKALWKQFRETFPYHSQVLALSDAESDGSRTLIVSEPPPHVTVGKILLPLADVLLNHSVNKQEIGNDGWAKDVVIAVKGSDQEVADKISSLNQLLFNTSYKSYLVPLPAEAPKRDSYDLDLNASAYELKTWILDQGEMFTPVEGGEGIPAASLFGQSDCGVYSSQNPGIVAWWIPKDRTIHDCRIQARQFALDSDLIIGALSKGDGILVLARERIVPVDALPPLRVETLALLAATQSGQEGRLAQSYERNHEFAGRINARQDWAPIYLSPELVDTEYGSLLNITDQLLKGWSNNGNTSYVNFSYPRPAKWPPFRAPVPQLLKTNSMVYNWNTNGAGYTVDFDQIRIMALNRTGALPVTYIPEGLEEAENIPPHIIATMKESYDYFATVSDPNLVRVVQYAAMYQLFSAFDIKKSADAVTTNTFPESRLKSLTSDLNSEIRSLSDKQMLGFSRELLANIPDAPYEFRSVGYIRSHLELIRDYDEPGDDIDRRFKRDFLMPAIAAIKKLPETYVKEVDENAESSPVWIHTPVIVLSTNIGSFGNWVGGHNLDAKVTRFRLSEEVRPGQARIDAEGNIIVNPRDAGKVGEVVRIAGRNGENGLQTLSKIDSTLGSVVDSVPRIRAEALKFSPNVSTANPSGFNFLSRQADVGTRIPIMREGWGRFHDRPAILESDRLLLSGTRQIMPDGIVIAKRSDGTISVVSSERSSAIEAFTPEDATDVVVQLMRNPTNKTTSMDLDLHGFSPQEAQMFIRSCQVRASKGNVPKEITGLVRQNHTSNEFLAGVKQRRFDFSRSEIKVSDVEVLPNGTQRSVLTVEVPSVEAGVRGSKITAELNFSKTTPRNVISIILRRVREAIKRLTDELGENFDMLIFNYRLNREIKRISRETGVDFKIVRQQVDEGQADLYFVQRIEPRSPDQLRTRSSDAT